MPNLNFLNIDRYASSGVSGGPEESEIYSISLLAKYYEEYYLNDFKDLSFIMVEHGKTLGYVTCCALGDKICYPNDGVSITFFVECPGLQSRLYQRVHEQLSILAEKHSCREIVVKDFPENVFSADLSDEISGSKLDNNYMFEMNINYKNFEELNFHKSIRKSYKSLVNWGKNNLQMKYINQYNDCTLSFKAFKDFHQKIAGKKTRSDESWNAQYEMIRLGFGELLLAYYEDNLVSGALFTDNGNKTNYFTGVYDRDLFRFGISHYVVYDGICRSPERGNTDRCFLGYYDKNQEDTKAQNIQFFKKGFCKELTPVILWTKLVSK